MTGIAEKLNRTKENIGNLDSEIVLFFQKCDYPVLPKNDRELRLKAIEYHKNLPIPPRFSVLAGEAVHQLRSCFDHVAWHFSVGPIKNVRQIEFPVFEERPIDKKVRERFDGKIQGITNLQARDLIETLQPYNATDPSDDPLLIIHNFDIIDKHRELVLCSPTGSTVFPPAMESVIESYKRANPHLNAAEIAHHFKDDGIEMPCISFRDFGRRDIYPVIRGLTDLFNYTADTMRAFEAL